MRKSEDIAALTKSLLLAQQQVKSPAFDRTNPHFKSRYASLGSCIEAIIPLLNAQGIAVTQSTGTGQRGPTITTLLLHTSGQWLEYDPLEVPAPKADAQAWGSAITYGRRYSLLASAGVAAEEDDDGAEASRPAPAKKAAPPPAPETKREPTPKTAPPTEVHIQSPREWLEAAERYALEEWGWAEGELANVLYDRLGQKYPGKVDRWGPEAVPEMKRVAGRYKATRKQTAGT